MSQRLLAVPCWAGAGGAPPRTPEEGSVAAASGRTRASAPPTALVIVTLPAWPQAVTDHSRGWRPGQLDQRGPTQARPAQSVPQVVSLTPCLSCSSARSCFVPSLTQQQALGPALVTLLPARLHPGRLPGEGSQSTMPGAGCGAGKRPQRVGRLREPGPSA